ncbi:hypothetical protein ACFO0A_10195 [Novosphingobium tardum]|uniref:Uncharacterized protein n=1 Tax=Novosphingobium tardum TaxID=1538021 RepID=A0ABV8RPZ1_9SPHN
MQQVNWDAPATLQERDDGGSDLHYHFRTVRDGTLAELVRAVGAMPTAERARMVIDVAGGNTINLGQILDLAAREDLP